MLLERQLELIIVVGDVIQKPLHHVLVGCESLQVDFGLVPVPPVVDGLELEIHLGAVLFVLLF